MYIITMSENVIVGIGEVLDYMEETGYPLLVNENVSYVPDKVTIYENVEVSEEIKNNWFKYCYTPEQGFYLNPNYIEPDPTNTYGVSDDVYHQIIDDYTAEIYGGTN